MSKQLREEIAMRTPVPKNCHLKIRPGNNGPHPHKDKDSFTVGIEWVQENITDADHIIARYHARLLGVDP